MAAPKYPLCTPISSSNLGDATAADVLGLMVMMRGTWNE